MAAAQFDVPILIDALEGVRAAELELKRVNERYISRLGWTRLLATGLAKDQRVIEGYLGCFTVVELSEQACRRAAQLMAQRPAFSLFDAMELACAQVAGRIFVTRNPATFPPETLGVRIPYTL